MMEQYAGCEQTDVRESIRHKRSNRATDGAGPLEEESNRRNDEMPTKPQAYQQQVETSGEHEICVLENKSRSKRTKTPGSRCRYRR